MSSESYALEMVTSVSETDMGAEIQFADGCTGVLPATHPEYRWSVDRLKLSRDHHSFVGIRFQRENRIGDVAGADRNRVIGLRENEHDQTVLDVWFEGESGPWSLHKGALRFQQLHTALSRAKQSHQWIWYVRAGSDLLDVKLVSPEEDAALCRLVQQNGQR
jgi:hypothetical protein